MIMHYLKIGLRNIRMKYELLQQDGFTITQEESSFTVTMPLLPPQLADERALGLTK